MLVEQVRKLEGKLSEQENELSALQNEREHTIAEMRIKQETDEFEIIALQNACEMQKADIETLIKENKDLENFHYCGDTIFQLIEKHEEELSQQKESFKQQLLQQEEIFHHQKTIPKKRVCKVT